MTKTEYVLDSLADDEEAKTQIMEYFVKYFRAGIGRFVR